MSKKLSVAIIDCGMGNVRSIENAIQHVGDYEVVMTSEPEAILAADVIFLPGVGAFKDAMDNLNENKLVEVLAEAVTVQKKPTLGICLGMQLLFDSSEEKGFTAGLGWIPGQVKYMKPADNLRVPHVGWNSLVRQPQDSIFNYLGADKDFYFVHSLHAVCDDKYVLTKFDYGELMVAAVKNDNVIGMQFHPEKSQKNGLLALNSFFNWAESYIGMSNAKN